MIPATPRDRMATPRDRMATPPEPEANLPDFAATPPDLATTFPDQTPVVAILAGGRSQRMGRDKSMLVLEGRTLLERTVDVAREVSDRVFVVGRTQGGVDGPKRTPDALLTYLADESPGQGPL